MEEPYFIVLPGKVLLFKIFLYVRMKYGLCTVVFDGYNSRSTKDHEHRRREEKVQPCADVSVKSGTNVYHTCEVFLSNINCECVESHRLIELRFRFQANQR